MPSPSSTFSFDTLQLRWGVPRGLLTALVLLVALDVGLSRADWPYRKYPLSYVGAFLAQEQALRSSAVPPRVIILGNSRSKCGLLPGEMGRFMGLPEGTVLNLSIESGDHYDNYIFQQRNRQQMKSARLLIYCVDAYDWNANFPLSERFHHFASLTDRFNLEPSADSLFGWFFRTEEKAALYHAIFRRTKIRMIALFRPTEKMEVHDLTGDQSPVPETLGPVAGRVAFWYKNFQLSPPRQALLRQLVATAREDGQQVVILQLPFQDEYMQEVFRSHPADYDAYKQSIRSLNDVHAALFEDASAVGLGPADFRDWDHLNTMGAAKFTQSLCDWLKTHEPDALAALTATAK